MLEQSNRPTGRIEETKLYYSGKHHLYGFKPELSVLPNGLGIGNNKSFPGSVSNNQIHRSNQDWNKDFTKKKAKENNWTNEGRLYDDYPDSLEILSDKGYSGLANFLHDFIRDKEHINE